MILNLFGSTMILLEDLLHSHGLVVIGSSKPHNLTRHVLIDNVQTADVGISLLEWHGNSLLRHYSKILSLNSANFERTDAVFLFQSIVCFQIAISCWDCIIEIGDDQMCTTTN